jgi:hypothetical protein
MGMNLFKKSEEKEMLKMDNGFKKIHIEVRKGGKGIKPNSIRLYDKQVSISHDLVEAAGWTWGDRVDLVGKGDVLGFERSPTGDLYLSKNGQSARSFLIHSLNLVNTITEYIKDVDNIVAWAGRGYIYFKEGEQKKDGFQKINYNDRGTIPASRYGIDRRGDR